MASGIIPDMPITSHAEEDGTITECVEYCGRTWKRRPGSASRAARYYFKNGDRSLHRQVYIDFIGEIPAGFHIHHRDGNPSNNHPDNLEAISASDHAKLHDMGAMLQSLEKKPFTAERIERMREHGKRYTSTEQGMASCRRGGQATASKLINRSAICPACGVEFTTRAIKPGLCSSRCRMSQRVRNRSCVICGIGFTIYGFEKSKTCSRECNYKLRSLRRVEMHEAKRAEGKYPECKPCCICGEMSRTPKAKTCSRECEILNRSERAAAQHQRASLQPSN